MINNIKAFERKQLQFDCALLFIYISTIFIKKRVLNSIKNESYDYEQSAKREFNNELNLNGERYDNEKDWIIK